MQVAQTENTTPQVALNQALNETQPVILPVYLGVAHQFFVREIQKEEDEQKQKFIATVANDYMNTDVFASFTIKQNGHLMFGNLIGYAMNAVVVDNLLSLDEQFERLKAQDAVDEAIYAKARGNYQFTALMEALFEQIKKTLHSPLPVEYREIGENVLVSKLLSSNQKRAKEMFYQQNIDIANDEFIDEQIDGFGG